MSFQENRDPAQVLSSYSAVDPEGAGITGWSLSGTDGGDFTISENGELTFRNTPNYEGPADSNRDNEYLVSVRASDGRYYGYFNVTVTVEDVNEPPAINTGSRSEFTFRENGTASLYTYRATDPERGDDYLVGVGDRQGRLCCQRDWSVLTFKETNPPNYEIPADSDRDNEYQVTHGGGETAAGCRALLDCHRHGHRRERGA